MKTHTLKTWPSYFEAIQRGDKRFEIRKNDRDFAIGDVLHLKEYDPGLDVVIDRHKFTDRSLLCTVTHIIYGGQFGIDPAFCVMSIQVTDDQS